MLLLLLTTGTGCATMASIWIATATGNFLSGKPIARRQLDLQLNNFIPLLIGAITLRNRKEFAQTATAIQTLRCRRWINNRRGIFGVLCSHQKSKCGALITGAPQ